MDRNELLVLRTQVYSELNKRISLGDFDANSEAIRLILTSIVNLTNHILQDMKKTKKCSPKD